MKVKALFVSLAFLLLAGCAEESLSQKPFEIKVGDALLNYQAKDDTLLYFDRTASLGTLDEADLILLAPKLFSSDEIANVTAQNKVEVRYEFREVDPEPISAEYYLFSCESDSYELISAEKLIIEDHLSLLPLNLRSNPLGVITQIEYNDGNFSLFYFTIAMDTGAVS